MQKMKTRMQLFTLSFA